MINRREEYLRIFEYMGLKTQLKKLLEEIMELEMELVWGKELSNEFYEESSDVLVVLLQFYFKHKSKYDELMLNKINRTTKLIEEGFYKEDRNRKRECSD